MSPSIEQNIESQITRGDTSGARKLIRAALRKKFAEETDRHFYLARIALTYDLDRQYEKALTYAEEATALAPWCAMAAEVEADILLHLGHYGEAIAIYKLFIKKGAEYLAGIECGEGIVHARSVIADSLYSTAWAYMSQGKFKLAIPYLEQHIARREEGYRSGFSLREARKELAALRVGRNPWA